jgi:hypothetical protein
MVPVVVRVMVRGVWWMSQWWKVQIQMLSLWLVWPPFSQ